MKTSIKSLFPTPSPALRLAGGLGFLALGGIAAPLLSASPILADISVQIGLDAPPPPPRAEVIVQSSRPGPDYVWVAGYWDGTPGHYSWVGGHWDRPPHGHARWIAPRWEKDHDGHYHQIKGEWR